MKTCMVTQKRQRTSDFQDEVPTPQKIGQTLLWGIERKYLTNLVLKPIRTYFFQRHRKDFRLLMVTPWNDIASPLDPYTSHVPGDSEGRMGIL